MVFFTSKYAISTTAVYDARKMRMCQAPWRYGKPTLAHQEQNIRSFTQHATDTTHSAMVL